MNNREGARGFTLIELIIYSVLLGLVLAIVGGLLANAFRALSTVRSSAVAHTNGQLVLSTIETAFRNGSGAEVSDSGKLLVVRIPAGADWECQAWYYNPASGGSVYTTTTPTRAAIDTATSASEWTLLASNAGAGLAAIFTPVTVTSPTGAAVTVRLNLSIDGQADVALTTSAAPRLFRDDRGDCF